MWVAILGATGTGKRYISSFLEKDGFELLDHDPIESHGNSFQEEFRYMLSRFKLQMLAFEKASKDRDVITIRSVSCVFHARMQAALKLTTLKEEEYDLLASAYEELSELLVPRAPDFVIYAHTNDMSAMDRMLLNNDSKLEVTPEFHKLELDGYARFMDKVRVPRIDIDVSRKPKQIEDELEFSINSLKMNSVGKNTIWQKRWF